MKLCSQRILKVAGLSGVISPLIGLLMIYIAILNSPWFGWRENALSDLGVSGIASVFFNSGLIVSGVLIIFFSVGLREALKKTLLGNIGSILLTLDGLSLMMIGFFPETCGLIHLYVSVSFFTLLPISLSLIGVTLLRNFQKRVLGIFTLIVGFITIIAWLIPVNEVAIAEIASSLAASIWLITIGVGLYKRIFLNP